MKLDLIRKDFTERSTCGDLLIDDKYFCHTLEDTYRETKIPGETCIPYGTYEVITNWSNRFKRVMPLLLNVPGFEGVRIHAGNTDKDTEGCILLGYTPGIDYVGSSRAAMIDFMILLRQGLEAGKVKITISKG